MEREINTRKSIIYLIKMGLATGFFLLVKRFFIGRDLVEKLYIDSYNLALTEINLLAYLTSTSLMLSLIGVYRTMEEERGRDYVLRSISSVLNFLILTMGALLILVFFILKLNIFKIDNLYFLNFLQLGLAIILLTNMKIVFTSFLQMRHGFFAGARGNLFRAVLYAAILAIYSNKITLSQLMILGVIASVVQFIIALKGTEKLGYSYRPTIELSKDYTGEIFINSILIFISLLLYDYILLVKHDNYLVNIGFGIIISSIITVIYPLFCEEYEKIILRKDGDYSGYNQIFLRSFFFLDYILLPILLLILFYSSNIKLFLGLTGGGNLFINYGLGFLGLSLFPFLFRVSIGYRDFVSPILSLSLALILAISISKLGLSSSLSYDIALIISNLYLLFRINKRLDFTKNVIFRFNLLKLILGFLAILLINLLPVFLGLKNKYLIILVVFLSLFIYGYLVLEKTSRN